MTPEFLLTEVERRFALTPEQTHLLLVAADRLRVHAWDESEHPRHPEGSSQGGEFAPKGAKEPTREDVEALVRKWIDEKEASGYYSKEEADAQRSDIWAYVNDLYGERVGRETGYEVHLGRGGKVELKPYINARDKFDTWQQKEEYVRIVAGRLGWPDDSVHVYKQQGPEFEVAGAKMNTAGLAHLDDPKRLVTVYTHGLNNPRDVVRLMAHEVTHHRYDIAEKAFRKEWDAIQKNEGIDAIRPSGALKEGFQKKYPVYAMLAPHFGHESASGTQHGGIGVREAMAKSAVGISSYADKYWAEFQKERSGRAWRSAVHETLAEIASREAGDSYFEAKRLPMAWSTLYQRVKKSYSIAAKHKLPVGRVFAEEHAESAKKLGPFVEVWYPGRVVFGIPQETGFKEFDWDESKHPRHPEGSSQGGEFAPKEVIAEVKGSALEVELIKRLGGPREPSAAADLYAEHKTGTAEESEFISGYGGKSYSIIANRRLREGKTPKEVEKWDKAFAPLKKDVVTFRGMHDEDPTLVERLAKVGTVISNAGYTSSAFHVENASWFIANNVEGASVMMKIRAPKGTRASVGAASERELVFARGSKLKITKVHPETLLVEPATKTKGKENARARVVLVEAEVVQ